MSRMYLDRETGLHKEKMAYCGKFHVGKGQNATRGDDDNDDMFPYVGITMFRVQFR